MTKPSRKVVRAVLSVNHREKKLASSIYHAWDAVQREYPKWFRRKNTLRELMWEHTVRLMIKESQSDPGWRYIEEHGTVRFTFDETAMIRVKKANARRMTCNIPTETAQLFADHGADLFGFKGWHRADAIYIPNEFNTKIRWAGLVARIGNTLTWEHRFTPPQRGATIQTLPKPKPRSVTSLITPKGSVSKNKKGKSTRSE